MPKKPKRRVRHLNDVPAKVHLHAGKLRVIVQIPWADLERRLRLEIEAKAKKKFRRKRRM